MRTLDDLSILASVDDVGFLVIDRTFTIQAANRAYLTGAGLPEDQVVGMKCHLASHASPRPCFETGEECPLLQVFETGSPATVIHRHVGPGGRKRLFSVKAYPLRDAAGNIAFVVETTTDITDTRKSDEEARQIEKLDSFGEAAGSLAHDFNNLLMGVSGYLSLARARADGMLLEYLEAATAALEEARTLTQPLSAISRSRLAVRRPLLLVPLVEKVTRLTLENTGVSFEITPGRVGKRVLADEAQIALVLRNLLANALEAMPEGGKIRVSVGERRVGSGWVQGLQEGDFQTVSVADEGIGIPRDIMARVFDPGFTTRKNARGLGLTLAYTILRRHDGAVVLESAPGMGCTATILLPLDSGPPLSVTPGTPTKAIGGTGRILVMDDDLTLGALSLEMLRKLGYRPEFVLTGEAACRRYREALGTSDSFAACILDLVIQGGMGGRETVRALRELDPGVRALASSGDAQDPAIRDCAAFGFLATLVKPFTLEELDRRLAAVLRAAPVSPPVSPASRIP